MTNTVNLNIQNRFGILKEQTLHDKTIPQPPLTVNKRVITPKINVISIKVPNTITEKMNLIESIKVKSRSSFTVNLNGIFMKLHPETAKDYQEIIKVLDEMKVEHFLFLNRTVKPLKVVIRGLSIDMDTIMIAEELKKTFPVFKVAQLIKFKTQNKMPLFQIQLEDGPAAREIFKLNTLLHHIINVEIYNRHPRVLQCFTCQYWHHSSTSCKLNSRCCKCDANDHETPNYLIGKGKIDTPTCCNCGQNHAASYRGCPKSPKIIRLTFNKTSYTPKISYANVLNPQTTPTQSTTQGTLFQQS